MGREPQGKSDRVRSPWHGRQLSNFYSFRPHSRAGSRNRALLGLTPQALRFHLLRWFKDGCGFAQKAKIPRTAVRGWFKSILEVSSLKTFVNPLHGSAGIIQVGSIHLLVSDTPVSQWLTSIEWT